jgi:hypothetical protein
MLCHAVQGSALSLLSFQRTISYLLTQKMHNAVLLARTFLTWIHPFFQSDKGEEQLGKTINAHAPTAQT